MQRGFTLAELLIVVGIIAAVSAGGALALGSRPLAVVTARTQFQAQVDAARALATAGAGAEIVVTADGSGFRSSVSASTIPDVRADASITEESAGAPPFTLSISSGGDFSISGVCPASGEVRIRLSDPSSAPAALRFPCRSAVFGTPDPAPSATASP